MAAWRIVIDRNDFRALVAGREVRTTAGPDEIFVRLDLDWRPGLARWSDPPQADEFYGKSAKPEIDQFVDDWVEKRGQHQRE
jgi:hypothetical protein